MDPLGLERCAVCNNAFSYDADEEATKRAFPNGGGFVCKACARDAEED